jgi:hypothetical protein
MLLLSLAVAPQALTCDRLACDTEAMLFASGVRKNKRAETSRGMSRPACCRPVSDLLTAVFLTLGAGVRQREEREAACRRKPAIRQV